MTALEVALFAELGSLCSYVPKDNQLSQQIRPQAFTVNQAVKK